MIVTGNSGAGKSAIIQHSALKYRSQGWMVKLVNEVKEIPSLYSSAIQNKSIFVLNDPIGKQYFDEIAYNSWESHEETLKICLKNVKVLLSCRKYILCDERVTCLLMDKENSVDINNVNLRLNNDEKLKIWNIHSNNYKLSKKELAEIFEIEEYYPLLCKLYFTNARKINDGILKFFKEPILVVEKEIRSFRTSCKEKYCALVLLAFLNDGLSINDLLENENSREKFKLALKLCGMQDTTAPYIIGDTLKTLQGFL